MNKSIKGRWEQAQVERGDGGGMCGDEASLRTMQGWQDGAARPTLQVAGTWGVHSCAHRCGLRGQLLNQVFPLNVHRNVKMYKISVSTVCCHHLPGPRGTNYVVRSCSRVSHEPVPSWAEHRGACVCSPLPGSGVSPHSRFHGPKHRHRQSHPQRPLLTAAELTGEKQA